MRKIFLLFSFVVLLMASAAYAFYLDSPGTGAA